MDLTLSLSYQEQNDNKAIILTDTSNWNAQDVEIGNGDSTVVDTLYEIITPETTVPTGFVAAGASANTAGTRFWADTAITLDDGEAKEVTPDVTEITVATLDTTITGVNGTPITKTQVDLFSEFSPFATQSDLVYTITAVLLGDTANSLLVDGLYELDYNITTVIDGTTETYSLNVTILVYGQVKVATYEKLRNIPVLYMCQDGCPTSEIAEADLCGAYLSGIENSAYVAKTEELLNMLIVLDNIIKNGSNITW